LRSAFATAVTSVLPGEDDGRTGGSRLCPVQARRFVEHGTRRFGKTVAGTPGGVSAASTSTSALAAVPDEGGTAGRREKTVDFRAGLIRGGQVRTDRRISG